MFAVRHICTQDAILKISSVSPDYLSQRWPRSLPLYGVTRSQWVIGVILTIIRVLRGIRKWTHGKCISMMYVYCILDGHGVSFLIIVICLPYDTSIIPAHIRNCNIFLSIFMIVSYLWSIYDLCSRFFFTLDWLKAYHQIEACWYNSIYICIYMHISVYDARCKLSGGSFLSQID